MFVLNFCAGNATVICHALLQALLKILIMATKKPGKNFQAGKGMAHLFPIHHETLKRKEREAEKGS